MQSDGNIEQKCPAVLCLQKIFDSGEPHHEPLPGEWNDKLDDFQKIIILKCLRPDKITNAMQDYVAKFLGQRFIEPQVSKIDVEHKFYDPCLS